MNALRERNFVQARDLFAKEVDRAPYYHEFHFWLAQSYLALGDMDQARKQLALALEYSDTEPRARALRGEARADQVRVAIH